MYLIADLRVLGFRRQALGVGKCWSMNLPKPLQNYSGNLAVASKTIIMCLRLCSMNASVRDLQHCTLEDSRSSSPVEKDDSSNEPLAKDPEQDVDEIIRQVLTSLAFLELRLLPHRLT